MPVSIYAVSYERNSAAFYEAFESSFYKDVCNLLYAYFGEDKGERERGRFSSVPYKTVASSLSEAFYALGAEKRA